MADCPPAESLERLLGKQLADPERERVEAHVGDCATCQETLHHLAEQAPGPVPAHQLSAPSGAAHSKASSEAKVFLQQRAQTALSAGADGSQKLQLGLSECAAPPVMAAYEIQEELGRGAVGVVYRARHRALNRLVALKMILAGPHLSPEARQRFRAEGQAIARLKHPNIVQVYEVGEHAGCPYLALELVEGPNLARWLNGLPQPPAVAARIIGTLAGAVEYAHGQGVIHRDLKPANVLVGGSTDSPARAPGKDAGACLWAENVLKIADFGLAKVQPGPGVAADQMTQSGMILGTPAYIAPEQARGQVKEVGPAADIYSLGAMLYEMLTGRPPFHSTSPMETLLQVANQEPVPATRLVPRVPRDLNTICLKCLEKDPRKRYSTARELAGDLERFLNYEPIRARPVGRLERGLRWMRRRPAQALALAGAMVLGMSLAGAGIWFAIERTATVRAVEMELGLAARLQRESALAEAGAALDRASLKLGQGGPTELHHRLDQARRELQLEPRLEAIHMDRATLVEGRFDYRAEVFFNNKQADRDYERVFREAGLGAVGDDPVVVAARVNASAAQRSLVAALDDWAVCAFDKNRQDWLRKIARRADSESWRDRVRDPAAWSDRAALVELAHAAPVARQPVELLLALGERLLALGEDATGFLARVQQENPENFWANLTLANALRIKDPAEGIRYYQAALSIRPGAITVYNNLGVAFYSKYQLDDAVSYFRQALRIDPKYAPALCNLGLALRSKGSLREAADYYRDALRYDFELAPAHSNLGEVLALSGGFNAAIDHYRQALRIDASFVITHTLLGAALLAKSRLDLANENYERALRADPENVSDHDRIHGLAQNDALDHYQQALEFDRVWAPAYIDLRSTPQDKSRLDEVIALYEEAIRINPDSAVAHGALGQVLLAQGRVREALAATRRCLDLLGQFDHRRPNLGRQLQRCERLLALEGRLQGVLQGKDKPADAAECLRFADLCRVKRQFAAAAELFALALLTTPQLADHEKRSFRYNAPIVAVLAASGQGENGANRSEAERARWRKQAREWLQSGLADLAKNLDSAPAADRVLALKMLAHWRADPDLAALRDPDALDKMAPEEAQECRKLLTDLDTLLNRAKEYK